MTNKQKAFDALSRMQSIIERHTSDGTYEAYDTVKAALETDVVDIAKSPAWSVIRSNGIDIYVYLPDAANVDLLEALKHKEHELVRGIISDDRDRYAECVGRQEWNRAIDACIKAITRAEAGMGNTTP